MRVIAVAAILCACRYSDVVADLDPLPAPDTELPSWFGLVDASERRIGGQLLDLDQHPVAGTVHLRIDAPDATVWIGRDIETGADGRFDFGVLRAGQYTLFATAHDRTSRVLEVDTRYTNRIALPLYVHPCTRQSRTIHTREGRPIADAQIDIAGTLIATTNANGAFETCTNADPVPIAVRASGFAPTIERITTGLPVPIVLAPSVKLRGRVVGPRGLPLAGVSVQPLPFEDSPPSPTQSTTDRAGRFVLHGLPEHAMYRARVVAHAIAFENNDVVLDPRSRDEVVVRPPDPLPERTPLAGQLQLGEGMLSGYVLLDGAPVVDAEVCQTEPTIPCLESAHTRADGAFDLHVTGFVDKAMRLEVNLGIRHASGLTGIGHAYVPAGKHVENMRIELSR